MHLVILDVDGTLVHSLEAEAFFFPRACEQALGITGVSSDWASYRCPSDRGIVRELVETRLGRAASAGDFALVEEHFLTLIRDAYRHQPSYCRAVPGAIEAIQRFHELPGLALAIATAGWKLTAAHKLSVAGYSVSEIPVASSNDAESKAEIMKIAAERAELHYGVEQFQSVVCFGDSAGDARAALQLGYEFVGIDTSGFVADARYRFADFNRLSDIMGTLSELQDASENRVGSEVDGGTQHAPVGRKVLRQAVASDIADIQRVRRAVRENRLVSTVISDDQVLTAIEETGRGWVFEAEGEVVAFAIGNADNGSVWALFVHPDQEHRGYGRLLHDTMIAWLWSQGLERLWLTTESGTRAQGFYEAAGWRLVGTTDRGELRYERSAVRAGVL